MTKPNQAGSDGTAEVASIKKEENIADDEPKPTVGDTSANTEDVKKQKLTLQEQKKPPRFQVPYAPIGGVKKKITNGQRRRAKWLVIQGYTEREAQIMALEPNPNPPTKIWTGQDRRLQKATPPPDGIRMAVAPKDYPKTLLTEEQSNELKALILKEVVQQKEVKPRFYNCSFIEGYLSVVCEDLPTRGWLKKTVPTLKLWEGAEIKVIPERNVLKLDVWLAYFPKSDTVSTPEILKFLENQNEGIDTSKWVVISRKEELRNKGTIELVMTVDPDSEALILEKDCMLNYQFKAVLFTKNMKNVGSAYYEVSKNAEAVKNTVNPIEPEVNSPSQTDVQPSSNFPIWDDQTARIRKSRFDQQRNASRYENRNQRGGVTRTLRDGGNVQRGGLAGDGKPSSSIWKEYERQMNACPVNISNNQPAIIRLEDLLNLNQQIGNNLAQFDNGAQLRNIIGNQLLGSGFNQHCNGTQVRNFMGNQRMGSGFNQYDNSNNSNMNVMGNMMGGDRGPNPSIWSNNTQQSNDVGFRGRNSDDNGNSRGGNGLPDIWNNGNRQMNVRPDNFNNNQQGNNFSNVRQRGNSRGRGRSRNGNRNDDSNVWAGDGQLNPTVWNRGDRQSNVRSEDLNNDQRGIVRSEDRQRGTSIGSRSSNHERGNRNRDDSRNFQESDGLPGSAIWNNEDRQMNPRLNDYNYGQQRNVSSQVRQRETSVGSGNNQYNRGNVKNSDNDREHGLSNSNSWNNSNRQMNARSDDFNNDQERNIDEDRQRGTSIGSGGSQFGRDNATRNNRDDRANVRGGDRSAGPNIWEKNDRQISVRSNEYNNERQWNIATDDQLSLSRQRAGSIGSDGNQYGRDDGNRNRDDDELPDLDLRNNRDRQTNIRTNDNTYEQRNIRMEDQFNVGYQRSKPIVSNQINDRSGDYSYEQKRNTRTENKLDADNQRGTQIRSGNNQYGVTCREQDTSEICIAPSPPRWDTYDNPGGDSPIGEDNPTDLYDPCNPDDQNDVDDHRDRNVKSDSHNAGRYGSRRVANRNDPFPSLDNRAPSPPKWNNYDQAKNSRSDDQFGRNPLGGASIRSNNNQYDDGSRSVSNTGNLYGDVQAPKRFKRDNDDQRRDVRSGDQSGMNLPMSNVGDSYDNGSRNRAANKPSYGNSGNVEEQRPSRLNLQQKNERVWGVSDQDRNTSSTTRNDSYQYGKRPYNIDSIGSGLSAPKKLENFEQRSKRTTEDLLDRNNQGVSSTRDSSVQQVSYPRIWNAGDNSYGRRNDTDSKKETPSTNLFVADRSAKSGFNQYPSSLLAGRSYGGIVDSRRDVQNKQSSSDLFNRNHGESGNRYKSNRRGQSRFSNINSNEVEQNSSQRIIGENRGNSGQSQFSRNSNSSTAVWNDNATSGNRSSLVVSKLGLF